MRKPTEFESLLTGLGHYIKAFNYRYGTNYSVEPYAGTDHITIAFPTKTERWALKMADKARKAADRGELTIEMREHVTAVFVHEFCASGIAICSPNDSYNADIGLAIAYCRAMDELIPDYVL